ncbi:MAG TPA: thiamine diphosphokinase [Clostridiales bacterium]|nr:thiamine diphosphokinase [Clostridiales bacterium]
MKKELKALIVCSGKYEDYSFYSSYIKDSDFIICVDGGASHIRKMGATPHLLLGDFDSIDLEDYNYFSDLGVEIKEFPREKDETDTELAVDYAVNAGCREVTIIGGIGTRFDHTLANIFLLKKMLNKGVEGWIINEYNRITLIDNKMCLKREDGIKVSLLPLSEMVEGITTSGLYYPLSNAKMEIGPTRGISNEFSDEYAEISITSGLLLVILAKD